MVNTGRPSRGCDLCRKRKIKCDETKPSCRNCRKYGKDCPGYRIETPPLSRHTSSDGWKEANRTPDTLREPGRGPNRSPVIQKAIHSTTPELDKKKVQAQQIVWDQFQETRYSTTSLTAYQDNCFAWSPPPMAWSLPSPTIFTEPQDNLEDQAISYLFESGVLNIIASNISDVSTPDFICEMCRETSVMSSLNQAVQATALANLANHTYRPELHLRAHDQYGEALTALKIALADPQKCLEDQTLATLLILRICETLFAFNATHSTASSNIMPLDDWQSHIEGMHALLRMRGVTQLSTKRGRWLFEVVSKAVGLRSIMTCQKPDESLCRLENEFNLQHAGSLWPLASCSTFYLQTASKIRAQVRDLIAKNRSYRNYATFAGEMDTLVRAAEELDARLEGWLKRNEHWQALKTPPAETLASGVDATSLAQYYFTDPVVLLYRGRISFTRVKLHESVINGLSAKLEVLERELQYQSSSMITSSVFAVIDKEIMAHVETLQRNAAAILGGVACGLDDLDEEGRFVEVAGWPKPLALGVNDGTKLGLRTIEIYIHLAGLQRCEFITETQMQVSGRVLERIVDSFRAPLV